MMATGIRSLFKWLLIAISLIVSLLLVTVAALIFFGVRIDLDFLKGGVEASASAILEREVTIDGPAVLEFSDWPALEVQDVRIANVPGASESDFFRAGLARLQIGLFPLFKGEILLSEVTAENITLNLESNAQGEPNWVFGSQQAEKKKPAETVDAQPPTSKEKEKKFLHFGGVNKLSLKTIDVTYHDVSLKKTVNFVLEQLTGSIPPGKPITLDFEGLVQQYVYDLKFRGGSLDNLLARDKPWPFKLTGNLIGKEIRAEGNVAMRNAIPEANLDFMVREIDIGAILSQLGLVKGLTATTSSMGIKLSLSGDSLQEIARQSSMHFSVQEGLWRVESPTTDAFFDISSLNGDIVVEQGNALTMKLAGLVGKFPVRFIITGAPLVDYVAVPESVPLTIDAEFADSRLSFAGELALPITSRDLTLSLDFSTEKLDNLNEAFRLDLPPVGPVALKTRFQVQGSGYEMPKLDLQVGKSRLEGKMNLDTSQDKPKVDIELISDLLQIDDFDKFRKKAGDDAQVTEAQEPALKETEEEATEPPDKPSEPDQRNLLSAEVLNSFDADLLVEAREVASGKDRLGSGTLKVSLQDGQLVADPMRVDVPGGGVEVGFDYLPTAEGITTKIRANIEEFDIGILVRRTKPDADMGGTFTLDAALQSTAPDLKSMMEYANGHFDFALVPQNFSSGIIDLWAVNLLSAIMTEVSEKEQSHINCVVVRFGIEEGLMEEKAIYMDTSKMRVSGRAEIDFEFKELDIMLAPKAKNPEFFSLAVPIKIEGSFEDFGLGIGLIRLTGSLVSFITSPIHVPIRRIFVDEIPEDGHEACKQAWTITGEEKQSR